MTSANRSMRFAHHELLGGVLATLEGPGFIADAGPLHAAFQSIASQFPLLAPFEADDAVQGAIDTLVQRATLVLEGGRYMLTTEGRASCVSSKRTLFSQNDRAELEGASEMLSRT